MDPNELDFSGRSLLQRLLEPTPRLPIDHLWDCGRARPRVRIPLIRAWPLRSLSLVLTADASSTPLSFGLDVELGGPAPSALTRALTSWTTPLLHDPTLGWTRGVGEYVSRWMDVDGLGLWGLAPTEGAAPHVRIASSLGHVLDLRLDAGGGVLTLASPLGRVDLDREDVGQLASVVLSTGEKREELARFVHDGAGLVRRIERPGRSMAVLDYDARGRLIAIARDDAASVRYAYLSEHDGRLGWARIESSVSGSWEVAHPSAGATIAVHAETGRTWSERRDGAGRLSHHASPGGVPTRIERDPHSGAPVELSVGAYRRHFYYDADGFVVLSDDSSGGSTELRYDEAGRLVLAEHGDRQLLRRAYDLNGRLVVALGPTGASELEWNDAAQCARLRRSEGERALTWAGAHLAGSKTGEAAWRAQRDNHGRIAELVGPEGEHLWFRCARDGEVSEWRSADGFMREYEHSAGALVGHRDASDTVRVARDAEARLLSVPQLDVHVRHAVDDGFVVTGHGVDEGHEGGPDALTTTLRREGRVAEVLTRDPALGRITRRAGGGRPTIELTWSPTGELARAEWAEPAAVDASFEGQETRARHLACERDLAGRLVRASLDDRVLTLGYRGGFPIEEQTDHDRVTVGRSEAGYRLAATHGRGLRVEYERDGAHRVVRLIARFEGALVEVQLGYDRNGRERLRRIGPIEVQLTRDSLGRVTQRRIVESGRALESADYVWRGARLQATRSGERTMMELSHAPSGVLLGMRQESAERIATWGDEAAPYRGHLAGGCRYDAAGRPVACGAVEYTHDGAGRRVLRRAGTEPPTRFAYDAFNRLVLVETPQRSVRHSYDPLGRRISTLVVSDGGDEARVEYGWDGPRLVHRDEIPGQRVAYVYADGVLVALLVGSSAYIVLPDLVGEVDALIDSSGARVWSRRASTPVLGTVDEGIVGFHVPALAGHHFDPASELWFSWRGDFDPETARYLVPNPYGLSAGPWLYGRPPDPFEPRSTSIERSVAPFGELARETFDTMWNEMVRESLSFDRDEAGLRAWCTLCDEHALDPERVLSAAW